MAVVKIRIDDDWEDVSVYVAKDVTIQDRIDSAFGVGSTNCWINRNFNIPPYTLINVDGSIYCGYSTCNKYIQQSKYYLHQLSILPLESYLACFVIGTKAFSTTGTNTTDCEKIAIIFNIINDKYGIAISMNDSIPTITKSKEYQYGAGSTAWDIISDICKNNDARPVLSYNAADDSFTFNAVSIYKSYKTIPSKYLSNAEYTQSMDDYCKYLETEASNVVDRTTITHIKNLTCRTEDPILTSDNAKLYLPSNVESIIDFGISNLERDCYWEIIAFKIYNSSGTAYSSNAYKGDIGTLIDNGKNPLLITLYNDYFYKYYDTLSAFRSCVVTYNNDTSDSHYRLVHTSGITGGNTATVTMAQSLIDRLLPREKWDLLTTQTKTSYAYYDHGGNTIENMNGSYKDDLFNILLGNSGSPMLSMTFDAFSETITIDGYTISMNVEESKPTESTTSLPHSTDPAQFSWYVNYYAICDPRITSTKKTNPLNEDAWKNIGRSYGNSASYIDYDKIITSMNRSNSMMGDTELTLEMTLPGSYSVNYYAGDRISYDSTYWYISSIISKHMIDYKTITMNLVRNYSKVAECIGVDTQYNATKNPLNSIIDRPIEIDGSFVSSSIFSENYNYFFRIMFYGSDGKLTSILYKPAIVMRDSNGNTIFYCSADSQYSFGAKVTGLGKKKNLVQSYYQEDCPYVDSNSECLKITAQIVILPSFDYDTSQLMPEYTGDYTIITTAKTINVYKDARERLTFTYVVNVY